MHTEKSHPWGFAVLHTLHVLEELARKDLLFFGTPQRIEGSVRPNKAYPGADTALREKQVIFAHRGPIPTITLLALIDQKTAPRYLHVSKEPNEKIRVVAKGLKLGEGGFVYALPRKKFRRWNESHISFEEIMPSAVVPVTREFFRFLCNSGHVCLQVQPAPW